MRILRLIEQNSKCLTKIYNHPFNINLFSGKLPSHTFRNYLEQDSLYLPYYAKALKIFASRLSNEKQAQYFCRCATETVALEQTIQREYLRKLASIAFFAKESQPIKKSQITEEYTKHLLDMAQNAPLEVAVVCFIPCLLIYRELGEQLGLENHSYERHPYGDWIKAYTDEAFKASTKEMIVIAEEIIEERLQEEEGEKQIAACLATSIGFEYRFFEDIFPSQEEKTVFSCVMI